LQLDKTRIPVLERTYDNLLDLTLVVVRRHALPLLATSLLGAVPFAVLNYFLLAPWMQPFDAYEYAEAATWYSILMVLVVCWEAPLASIPTTLYLGEALFVEKPDVKRMWQSFRAALPQLIGVQVLFRAALVGMLFLPSEFPDDFLFWLLRAGLFTVWIFLYWFRPYLNEIILLERNPWRGGPGVITTRRRAANLHGYFAGNLFGRWLAAVSFGLLWVTGLAAAIFWVRMTVTNGELDFSPPLFEIWLPVALWIVVSYFNVVRFLSYLDLRIRGEGWEIELRMRAEANRLRNQLA
jgi:hypothetical protein